MSMQCILCIARVFAVADTYIYIYIPKRIVMDINTNICIAANRYIEIWIIQKMLTIIFSHSYIYIQNTHVQIYKDIFIYIYIYTCTYIYSHYAMWCLYLQIYIYQYMRYGGSSWLTFCNPTTQGESQIGRPLLPFPCQAQLFCDEQLGKETQPFDPSWLHRSFSGALPA